MNGVAGAALPWTSMQGSFGFCGPSAFVLAHEKIGHAVAVALDLSDAQLHEP